MLNKECISNFIENKKSSYTNNSNDSTSIEKLSIINPIKPFSISNTNNIIKEVYEDNFLEELKKLLFY